MLRTSVFVRFGYEELNEWQVSRFRSLHDPNMFVYVSLCVLFYCVHLWQRLKEFTERQTVSSRQRNSIQKVILKMAAKANIGPAWAGPTGPVPAPLIHMYIHVHAALTICSLFSGGRARCCCICPTYWCRLQVRLPCPGRMAGLCWFFCWARMSIGGLCSRRHLLHTCRLISPLERMWAR